jgi:hypothetical protein
VLTKNEILNLPHLIDDVKSFNTLIIDSNSTDGTFEILENRLNNAHLFKKSFIDFYDQWNFALEKAIELGYTNGILIDADYRLSEEIILYLNNEITINLYANFTYRNIFGKINNTIYPKRLLGGNFRNIRISKAGHTQNFEFINLNAINLSLMIEHYDLKEFCFDFIKQKKYSKQQVHYDINLLKKFDKRIIKLKNLTRFLGIGAVAIFVLLIFKNKFILKKSNMCYLSNRVLYEILYFVFFIKKIITK